MDNAITPKISVILPVFNGEKYLRESIQSVLDQTFTDFELIVINDGSTDESLNITRSFGDKRILILDQKNQGLTASLNRGISESKGKYIARIDADDVWIDKNKLKKQFEFLEKNMSYSLLGTNAHFVNVNEKVTTTHYPLLDVEIRQKILIKNPFIHSAVIFRKDIALQCGMYDPREKYVEDYGLWLRMGQKGKFANFPDHTVKYRINASGVTQTKNVEQIKNSLLVVEKNKKYYPNFFLGFLKWKIKLLLKSL